MSLAGAQVGQGDYAMNARWSGGSCAGAICTMGSLSSGTQVVNSVEGRTGDAYNWVGPHQLTAWASADSGRWTAI